MSEAVNVVTTGGTPTLTLNDGGTATYDAAKSTATALVFDYTVAAGQNTAALAVTGNSLNGGTITDGAGNAANLAGADVTFTGLQIATTAPTVTAATATPATGEEGAGASMPAITLAMSEAVNVVTTGGTPTLTLNDGGTATYDAAKSTATALVFDYTVAAGQNTAALAVTGNSLNGGSITDGAGNAANLAGADVTSRRAADRNHGADGDGGPATPATGEEERRPASIAITLAMSEAVNVVTTGGTPTLTLNDGGTATYDAAKSTATALVFDYTVAAGQNTRGAGGDRQQSQRRQHHGRRWQRRQPGRRRCDQPAAADRNHGADGTAATASRRRPANRTPASIAITLAMSEAVNVSPRAARRR